MIESLQNDKIKYITRLITDNRFRKKSGVFVVEGKQENSRAMQFGFLAQEFFVCESIYNDVLPEGKVHLVSEKIYEKLAYRGSSEGILGVFEAKEFDLNSFNPRKGAGIIVLESVEKPGNLGAILRSCEAFGIEALIVTDAKADIYNPNVLRSSVGCLFGMNVFLSSNRETYDFLKKNDFKIYSTFMDEKAKEIQVADLKGDTAIVFGTEHSGLSDFWLDKSENILIPMVGTIDSLNLSNAVAITCFELLRQNKA